MIALAPEQQPQIKITPTMRALLRMLNDTGLPIKYHHGQGLTIRDEKKRILWYWARYDVAAACQRAGLVTMDGYITKAGRACLG